MTSQYDAYMLHAGLARLRALMHVHLPMHPGTDVHMHIPISNTCYFSTATVICKHATMLCYTYIVCLVILNYVPYNHKIF
jgi:hypothetical protein